MSICSTYLVDPRKDRYCQTFLFPRSFLKITLNSYFCSVSTRDYTGRLPIIRPVWAVLTSMMFFLSLVLWDVLLWAKYWVMKRNNLQDGCSKARSHAQLFFFPSCHLFADLGNVKYLPAVHAKPHDHTKKWRLTCYWTGRNSIYDTENQFFVSSFPIWQVTGNSYSF